MTRKILLGIAAALLIIGIIYLSIRAFRMKQGMPDNIILSPTSSSNFKGVDSVLLKASDTYMASGYRRFILGKNYREAWDAPIKAPVLQLDTMHGGLSPVKAGGGGQTRSLILEDKHGHKFAMRTVNKDAMPSLPTFGKVLGLKNMVIDGVSAGHPYASLAVANLCEAAGIIHTQPKLVFVPQQPALDTFNADFGNRLYIIEYEQEAKNGNWTGIDSVFSTLESEEVLKRLLANPGSKTKQANLLYARLFDLIIDDWDRHPGNWGWVEHLEDGSVHYTPFPVDRDMAFYHGSGIGTWIFNRPGAMGKFRPFLFKKNYLKTSFYKARLLDHAFLNELTREDFLYAAQKLQQQLTDKRIREAFLEWPDTLQRLDAAAIANKIIKRRNDLPYYAEAFYKHLAKAPEIMGTNQKDSFIVRQISDAQLVVEIFSAHKPDAFVKKYQRTFQKKDTQVITLFGWDGDDVLHVHGKPFCKINFVGGKGTDRLVPDPQQTSSQRKIVLFDDPKGIIAPKEFKIKKEKLKAKKPRA